MQQENIKSRKSLELAYDAVRQLISEGDFKRAEIELLEVIRAYPGASDAYRLLVNVEQRLGKTAHVKLALEQLCSLEPTNALLWCDLGDIYYFLCDWDLARDAYKRATELDAGDRRYLARLAYSQFAGQMFAEIEVTRRALLENHADFSITHLVDGHLYKSQGKLAEAAKAYERAVEIDPDFCEAIFNLVQLKTPAAEDSFTARIERLLEKPGIGDADRAQLYFALARIFENDRQFRRAFESYGDANQRLQRSMAKNGSVYDPQLAEKQISDIIAAYPINDLQRPIEPLQIDLTPIFIVGMPRSGTTMIEQILGSHPGVSAGGEMTLAQTCNRQYVQKRKALQLGTASEWDEQSESDLLSEIRESYLEYLFAHDLDGDYVTDKLPGNFEILGFIRRIFPNAIIVHCNRDPVATCWSLYTSNFGEHDPYYTSLEHLTHYYGQYRRLMEYWSSVLQPEIVEVNYESFVASPDEGIRHLLFACGLPWDDRCQHFYANPRPVITASFGQVRQGIYTTSINKWQNYEPYLKELMKLQT
ncbi:MAG: sulfotransferase [Xanthomonadales bacterium]|nr:sulfotransferase [Xanthomonadales bacterium]